MPLEKTVWKMKILQIFHVETCITTDEEFSFIDSGTLARQRVLI